MSLFPLFLTLCLTASAGAQNTNLPQVIPEVVIPFMAAPQIDGKIAPGEWNTFHTSRFVSQQGDLLVNRPGEFWIGSDGKSLFVAVRSAVHPVAGPLEKSVPHGDADISDVIFDDAIELWFDNSPGQSAGQYYQIMVNPNGAIYDASYDLHDKIAQKAWRAPLQQAHTVANGVWTAEFAIPFAALGVKDPTQPLAIRVCRDYKLPWDQARWEPMVRAFESPETMGKVRFSASAPIVNELGMQDKDGINIGVELTNPGANPLPVKVKIGGNPQDQPRYYQTWDATLAPGQTTDFAWKKPFFTADDYPEIGEILVTDPAGGVLFHRDFKWHTAPDATKFWDVVAPQSPEEATTFAIAWYPTAKVLRFKTDFAHAVDANLVKAARLVVVSDKGEQVGQTQSVPDHLGVARALPLPHLGDGTFTAELFLDGATPAAKPIKTAAFENQNEFVWKDNQIGVSDQVIPPFTPLKVAGNMVSAILRTHTMTSTGLWSQVNAKGEDILSAPMRFEVRQGGVLQKVKAKMRFTEEKPNQVTTLADWGSGSLQGQTRSEFDYDGCMKVTLDLTDTGAPVDGLDLVIPLKNDAAPLMHACGEGLRSNYGGFVPAGQGEVWNSAQASRDQLLGPFVPYLWVGGEERGLVWFAGNDRGWIVDESGKTPAVALERDGETLNLRVRLIQKPAAWAGHHVLVFGLQATPVKPMPEDPNWRVRGFNSGGKFETTVLGMSMYWGSDLYGVFPRARDFTVVQKIAAAKKTGVSDGPFFADYIAKNPDISAEIHWAAAPTKTDSLIPYTNLRGEPMTSPEWRVYQDEWRRVEFPDWRADENTKGSIDFSLTPVKSRQDYLLWYYRQLLTNGFDGIYWDNICIYDNANPMTGDAYRRDDGQWQTDTDIWELRELTKRTAVLFYQLGKRNLTMPHMTNADLIPVFSWTTSSLDWEWKYGGTDFQDRFTRDYIRAASLGLQSGNMPVILQGITEVPDADKRAWVERTRIAAVVPHEINIWQSDPLYQKIKAAFYEIGYGTPACTVYHYWEQHPVAQVTGLDSAWIVLRGPHQVALFLSDWGDGGTPNVKLDTARLGLPANFTAVNFENPDEKWTATDGTLNLSPFKKHDFRLLLINPSP